MASSWEIAIYATITTTARSGISGIDIKAKKCGTARILNMQSVPHFLVYL